MTKIEKGVVGVIIFLLATALTMVCPLSTLKAAVSDEKEIGIISATGKALAEGQPVEVVIAEAVFAAKLKGIPISVISAPLVEAVLEIGISIGQDKDQLCRRVAAGMMRAIYVADLPRDEAMPVLFQAVLSICAGAIKNKLNVQKVRARVKAAFMDAAGPDLSGELIARVVDSAYETALAGTYTPPGALLPPGIPRGVAELWDPTASQS